MATVDKIEATLKTKLEKGDKASIMISFGGTSEVLESITHAPDASRGDRASAVNKALEAHMNATQGGVVKLLKERNVEFQQFWINNNISVKVADKELVAAIAADPNVQAIKEEQVAHIMGGAN